MPQYDVFLSHNSVDQEAVELIARDLRALLTDPATCGYPSGQATQLLDGEAAADSIRAALADLAARTGPDDTAVVFFSGHGAHGPAGGDTHQYILPYDCDPADLPGTAISGDEMTKMLREIQASRLLVLFDSCHSGGAGDPKGTLPQIKRGLSEDYYQALAQGKGRVVIASSRPDEVSWALRGMDNSLMPGRALEEKPQPAKGRGFLCARRQSLEQFGITMVCQDWRVSDGETTAPTWNGWGGFALPGLRRCGALTSVQDGAILSRLPKMVVLSGHWQSYRDGGAALLPGKLLSD